MADTTLNTLYPTTQQGIPFYRSRAFSAYPQLKQAIFTRNGGISRRPFQSLNLSYSVGDDPASVEHNFAAGCAAIEVPPGQTATCYLVHGADVLTVTRQNRQPVMGYADGLITAEPGIFLYMRFADCTPLLFFDPIRQVVGLTHAGWRGTMQNVAGATVNAMANLGSNPADVIAVIGPAIGPCCYEVGAEVMDAAAVVFEQPGRLFRRNGRAGHAHFDMWAANRQQLATAGVNQIIQSGICTACHTQEFFSHRAEHGQTGRFGVILGLTGVAA